MIIFLPAIFLIFLCISLLTIFRSFLLYRFAIKIPFSDVATSVINGNVAALINIPFLGNLLGQNYSLNKIGIPIALTSTLMIIERVLLLASGGLMLSIILLFNNQVINISSNKNIFFLLAEMVVVLCLIFFFAFVFKIINHQILKWLAKNFLKIIPVILLNCLQWILLSLSFALGIFLVSGVEFSPHMMIFAFASAMLSSIPISIAGFGTREFVCILLFYKLGIDVVDSLVISLGIGVSSIAAILFLFFQKRSFKKYHEISNQFRLQISTAQFLESSFIRIAAYFTSILILFQYHYYGDGGYTLNINIADPFALIGLVYLLYSLVNSKIQFTSDFYSIKWIASIGIALFIGFLTSVYKIGFTQFAFWNKFIGFSILIGYSYIGALIVKNFGSSIVQNILNLQILGLLVICIWKLIILIGVQKWNFPKILYSHSEFEGFSQDRNAFGFILIIVLLFFQIFRNRYKSIFYKSSIHGFMYFCLYLTHSKTAIIVGVLLIFILLEIRLLTFKALTEACSYALLYFLVLSYYSEFINMLLPTLSSPVSLGHFSHEGSLNERMESIIEGLILFKKNFIIGAGLGAFKDMWINTRGYALIIHNTYVWVLAEMGIVGFCLFFFHPIRLCFDILMSIKKRNLLKSKIPVEKACLLGLFFVAGLYAIPHDIFYQRMFWFWFGICIALYKVNGLRESINSCSKD